MAVECEMTKQKPYFRVLHDAKIKSFEWCIVKPSLKWYFPSHSTTEKNGHFSNETEHSKGRYQCSPQLTIACGCYCKKLKWSCYLWVKKHLMPLYVPALYRKRVYVHSHTLSKMAGLANAETGGRKSRPRRLKISVRRLRRVPFRSVSGFANHSSRTAAHLPACVIEPI